MPVTAALVGAVVALDLVALILLVPVATGLADIGLARAIANTARQRLAELAAREASGIQDPSSSPPEPPGLKESPRPAPGG